MVTRRGWGGCTVSLVAEHAVPAFIARLRREYPAYQSLSDEQLKDVVFATQPSNGAFGEFSVWAFVWGGVGGREARWTGYVGFVGA